MNLVVSKNKFLFAITVAGAVLSGCATNKIAQMPNEESHEQLRPEQAKALHLTLRRHSTRGLYISPDIPPGKLANARQVCVTPPEEQVFALVDSTVLGGAEKCLLVGSTGVFFRNDWAGISPGRHFLSYPEFQTAAIGKNGFYEVSIGGINFNNAGCPMTKDAVINLLQDIQACLRNTSTEPTSPEPRQPEIARLSPTMKPSVGADSTINAEQEKTATAQSTPGVELPPEATTTWQSDFVQFVEATDKQAKSAKTTIGSEALFQSFVGKRVVWELEFMNIYKAKKVSRRRYAFEPTEGKKDEPEMVLGFNLEPYGILGNMGAARSILITFKPGVATISEWKQLKSGSKVKFEGVVNNVSLAGLSPSSSKMMRIFAFIDIGGIKILSKPPSDQ
jgi:hypothetical protein